MKKEFVLDSWLIASERKSGDLTRISHEAFGQSIFPQVQPHQPSEVVYYASMAYALTCEKLY